MKRLATLALAALCATAHAEFWDGNNLYERYNSSSAFEQGMTLGYIMGVADTALGVSHCAPPTSTAGLELSRAMQSRDAHYKKALLEELERAAQRRVFIGAINDDRRDG